MTASIVAFAGAGVGCGDSGSDDEIGSEQDTDDTTDESTSESTSGEAGTETETETTTETETETTTETETETETDTTETETDTTETETGEPDACSGPCGSPGCLDCPPSVVVDGGGFEIDATELPQTSYAVFLDENFDPDFAASWLPEECSWKGVGDFAPDDWSGDPVEGPPISGVDWCDAWAYCSWADKRLCGAIEGGPAEVADVQDATTNQWFRACSDGGTSLYPYGQLYDPDACNGVDSGFDQALDVGALTSCEGGVTGLYDMSGNVWEWTDACEAEDVPNEEQQCRRRGGSWFSDGPVLRCGINSLRARSFRANSMSFRCCE